MKTNHALLETLRQLTTAEREICAKSAVRKHNSEIVIEQQLTAMHWFQSPARETVLPPLALASYPLQELTSSPVCITTKSLLYRQDKNISSRLINKEIRQEIISFKNLKNLVNMKRSKSTKQISPSRSAQHLIDDTEWKICAHPLSNSIE